MDLSKRKGLESWVKDLPDEADEVVDGVLRICEAMDRWDCSADDLRRLFEIALCGSRQFAAIKMTMISWALSRCEDTPEIPS